MNEYVRKEWEKEDVCRRETKAGTPTYHQVQVLFLNSFFKNMCDVHG